MIYLAAYNKNNSTAIKCKFYTFTHYSTVNKTRHN